MLSCVDNTRVTFGKLLRVGTVCCGEGGGNTPLSVSAAAAASARLSPQVPAVSRPPDTRL